ncbi:MAG: diaminopimelate epimerase [Cytophagaceae bacterium]|nr:diaminopimelate epimerase [Cytophagaceae bacterium]
MNFFKYQGTGNDFVLIDDREATFPAGNPALIARLCNRRFGIGADGLILLQNDPDSDFRMVYFNADGREGSMCGNGGRCAVRFAQDLGVIQDSTRFAAVDGEHLASVCEEEIFLKMGDVAGLEAHTDYDYLDTGSPHVVAFVHELKDFDVFEKGQDIRYGPEWVDRGGTNVNFVEVLDEQTLFVRTYERGVEDETFSCGTGVTACALAAHVRWGMNDPIDVRTMGGPLRVSFERGEENTFSNIYLIGPAKRVFEGTILL